MNYLSDKLAKVFGDGVFSNGRRYRSLSPSSASIEIVDDSGSRIVGACNRQQFYRLKGYNPDKINDNEEKKIDWGLSAVMGDYMHRMLVDIIDTYGFKMGLQKLAVEHPFYIPQKNISGRTDMIVWDHNTNEPIGIEMKSIGEFKAKKAMEQPIDEHILQAMFYLHYYNTNIPVGQTKIKKWYLWYVSRTENWSIKAKAHSSQFSMLWDYYITLDDTNTALIHTPSGVQRWTGYTIEAIYKRYEQLQAALDTNLIPKRDYETTYSEEKITAIHKRGEISRKTDRDIIDKWLDKGAPAGKLKVKMGDAECMFCEYKKLCWEGIINTELPKFSNLPSTETKETKKESIFFL